MKAPDGDFYFRVYGAHFWHRSLWDEDNEKHVGSICGVDYDPFIDDSMSGYYVRFHEYMVCPSCYSLTAAYYESDLYKNRRDAKEKEFSEHIENFRKKNPIQMG